MQPSVGASDPTGFDLLTKLIGVERAAQSFPFGRLVRETRLLFGSGWPAQALDPIAVIEQVASGSAPAAEAPDAAILEPLKLKPAIDAYTSSGAWGSFDDQRKGSIAPGMLADLVVLSADVLEAPEKLETASVAVTIFDGKIVHRRERRALTEPAPSLQH